MNPTPSRAGIAILLAVSLADCGVGRFIDDVFKQHPPSPLQRAEVSSDARLDPSGAIVGSFVGEGTSRSVHLISSDTGLIAALVRQYRPLRERQGNVWGWLNEQRSYTIEVEAADPTHLRPATALVGSPDGHTSVSLQSVILHGSACGWRRTRAEFVVAATGRNGPSLRGPVVGSFLAPEDANRSERRFRNPPREPSPDLVRRLLEGTRFVLDSVLARTASSRDLPLTRPAELRVEVNTLADIDAADIIAFRLDDGKLRYAVSLRERREAANGTSLVAAAVMVWDTTGTWPQMVFSPTLLQLRRGRLSSWSEWPSVFWRRLEPLSGFAFARDYLWMEQVDVEENSVLWTVIDPRSNTVVAAAEVAGQC